MVFRPIIVFSLSMLVAGDLAATGLSPDKLNGLLNNSPFGASRAGAAAGTGTGDPLEFRAVLDEGGKQFYSIYEASSRRSTWVEVNDPANGFTVKSYDAAHDSVSVDFHGKPMSLAIKRAAPAVQTALGPVGSGPGNQMTPGGPGVDQQKLQQVQEEIRRRRALRQQPANQTGMANAANAANAAYGPMPMPVAPGDASAGPQPMPLTSANNPSGPPLPTNFPGMQPSGAPAAPQPAKP